MSFEDGDASRDVAEAVARRSYGKLVALLASRTRDVAGAEDALADAFAAALVEWPASGVPSKPEAWLLTVARRKQIDAIRRRHSRDDAREHLRLMAEEVDAAKTDAAAVPDERLALMFACAHPAIDPAVRAPLILQTILGFDAATIGSAFLVAPSTMAQRLVRASKIREADPFQVPDRASSPSAWKPFSRRSTPASPKAGRIRSAPRRGGATGGGRNLAGAAGRFAPAGGGGGVGPARVDALRAGAARRAPRRAGRVRAAGGTGSAALGCRADR
jgi:DNA-directed RNA polymerase specialized sigma24 family protein